MGEAIDDPEAGHPAPLCRSPRRATRRGLRWSIAGLAATALVAACTPDPGTPAPPGPPVIGHFGVVTARTEAPVTATYGWSVTDPNGDPLTCTLDVDGNGTVDRTYSPCTSADSNLVQFTTAGVRTPVLTVTDGTSAPVAATASVAVTAGPSEPFNITLRLSPTMRPEFRAAFEAAAARWEQVVVAGLPAHDLTLPDGFLGWVPAYSGTVDDVLIDARDTTIDGPGKVLGQAGGFLIRENAWQPYWGLMEFDTADLDRLATQGNLDNVTLHEMGHVLGLGANWALLGWIDNPLVDPAYTGPAGVAAYRKLGGYGYVPLENEGGAGTVLGHWRESVFGNELMTGYLDSGSEPLSLLTVAALADLGYGVDLSAADPYPIPSASRSAVRQPGEHLEVRPVTPIVGSLPAVPGA